VSGVLDSLSGLASPWAYLVIGLLAAAESAAFVGLVLPGEAAMLLGGFLAFQGRVSL
jgi:membrane-associated protein